MTRQQTEAGVSTTVDRKHANGRFVQAVHVDQLPQVTLHPLNRYPIPNFYNLEQVRNSTQSLAGFLATSSEPLHQQIAILSEAFIAPKQVEAFRQLPQEVQQVALVVRALDKGMQDFTLREKFAFFFRYTRYESDLRAFDWYPVSDGASLTDDCRSAVVKPEAAQIRYDRFIAYMDSLWKLSQTQPNILLSIRVDEPYKGGMYSEYDFWVQQQVQKAAHSIKILTKEELARETPTEFSQGKSEEELLLMFLTSQNDTRYRFETHAAPDIDTTRRRIRRDTVAGYFIASEAGELSLSAPMAHIARRLGINTTTVWEDVQLLAEQYRRQGKQVNLPSVGEYSSGPSAETIRLTQLIALAIVQLDKPGHRWKYGQYNFGTLTTYINRSIIPNLEKSDAFYGLKVTKDMAMHAIRDYMNPATAKTLKTEFTQQIPQVPDHKGKIVNNAIKTDVVAMLNDLGYPLRETIESLLHVEPRLTPEVQLLDQIIDTLGLITETNKNQHQARSNARMRVRKVLRIALQELEKVMPQS